MRRSAILGVAATITVAGALFAQSQEPADLTEDRVVRVVDVSTVELESAGAVELVGVGDPVSLEASENDEAARQATEFVREQLEGKAVQVGTEPGGADEGARTFVYIYLSDDTLFNAEPIKRGYARVSANPPFRFLEEFRRYEAEAREAERGLWAEDAILSDAEIRQILIRRSLASYSGSCACPYNTDRAGRRCGARSAYSRPGGASPLCYDRDVSDAMVANYRRQGR